MLIDDVEVCDDCMVHPDAVKNASAHMPSEERLYALAEIFKTFGDTTRIKILYVLVDAEMCVCDIAEVLGMTQSAISHQLKTLKQSRLVKFRRDGKSVLYSLSDNHVHTMLAQGMEHICE